jgi:hypothetical protein
VQAKTAFGTDWTDAADYAALVDADRSLFAWEWLRRDWSYREAADARLQRGRGGPCAADFDLVAFERPDLAVPLARPLWRSDAYAYVIAAGRGPVSPSADAFDVERLRSIARLVADGTGEHLLLCDGLRAIRVDGPRGLFTGGAACLQYHLAGLVSAEPPLLTLRRFLALCRGGKFSRSLHPPEVRARRWILMLRAFDAVVAGAGQREIAERLLSASAASPGWRDREPSLRSRAQRLVRSARQFARGAYRSLLA